MKEASAVYWLTAGGGEVPGESDWLTVREREKLEQLRFTKRRADWRLGRWTAKRAVCSFANSTGRELEVSDVEIIAADDGAPELFVGGERAVCAISISHARDVGFVVLAPWGGAVGCDVEAVEPRSSSFVSDYFTNGELELVAGEEEESRTFAANLIWSAKESVLKSMRAGMNRDTRSVEVTLGKVGRETGETWSGFSARCLETALEFEGWWRCRSDLVFTVSCGVGAGPPLEIENTYKG
jgi:4'-phosphopantetheinyl transferase